MATTTTNDTHFNVIWRILIKYYPVVSGRQEGVSYQFTVSKYPHNIPIVKHRWINQSSSALKLDVRSMQILNWIKSVQ